MNYSKIYNSLIERSVGRKLLKRDAEGYVYYEKHHIIPKCLGGSDKKDNLTLLTAEEHWIAHLLLVKIYPDKPALVYACQAMSMSNSVTKRPNNKMFGWIRRKYAEETSKRMKGSLISDETRAKISHSLRGRLPESQKNGNVMKRPEVAKKVSDAKRGKTITFSNPKERGEKISKGKLGKSNSFMKNDNPNNIRICCLSCKKETTYPVFKRNHLSH